MNKRYNNMSHEASRIKGKKNNILKALEKNLGIVSKACKEVGISTDAYYNYYNEDKDFKVKVDRILELVLDFAETALYKKINEGDTQSIIYLLKNKGRSRGYYGPTSGDGNINIVVKFNDEEIDDTD